MEKKTNKAKLEIFKFLRKSQGYVFYKMLEGNYALSVMKIANSMKNMKNY